MAVDTYRHISNSEQATAYSVSPGEPEDFKEEVHKLSDLHTG